MWPLWSQEPQRPSGNGNRVFLRFVVAYHASPPDYARLSFNGAQQDPSYEGDTSQYHKNKELANSVSTGRYSCTSPTVGTSRTAPAPEDPSVTQP